MKRLVRYDYQYIFLMIIFVLLSARSEAIGGWKSEREQLDNVYELGKFRVFYTLKGKNALGDASDNNKNTVPDIVENIALQLQAADRLYREVFKFTDPFLSHRYQHKIRNIDVHILDSQYKGESGDGVIAYNYRKIKTDTPSSSSLTITLSNSIKIGNLTPAHELIHSYQNGYTLFKNRWFTEGTARWIEHAFKGGTGKEKKLPDNAYDLRELLKRTYDAQYFWNRLFHLCSGYKGPFELPEELRNSTYVGSGQTIIEGNDLFGFSFMLKLLENLDIHDDLASTDKGFDKFHWKESDQKSPDNNRYILMALKETILASQCASIAEVRDFLDITDLYIHNKLPEANIAPDLTDKIENIGNPYEHHYKEIAEIYARNIWDMEEYKGLMFFGAGNSNNSGPVPNAGPVPIFSYDPQSATFRNEGKVDDEQITAFTVLNDILYIPGSDPTESHQYSNFYFRNEDSTWSKKRNIPGGLHTFSMTYFDQRLMSGISTKDGAAVAISANNGRDWRVEQIGARQRTYSMLVIGSQLYAMKQFLAKKDMKKWPSKLRNEYYGVAQYTGNDQFVPRYDLTENEIFPETIPEPEKNKRITRSLQIGNKALYLGAYNFKSPFGFFLARSLDKNAVDVQRVKLPQAYIPRDFLARGETLYLLCSEKVNDKHVQKVIRTSVHDLDNHEVLFQFSTSAFARSFEEIEGDFYFGLGSDVKSSSKWSKDEISPDTGRIIRISKKNIH